MKDKETVEIQRVRVTSFQLISHLITKNLREDRNDTELSVQLFIYSGLSLSRTRNGPRDLFEIERVRDREKLVNLRKTE